MVNLWFSNSGSSKIMTFNIIYDWSMVIFIYQKWFIINTYSFRYCNGTHFPIYRSKDQDHLITCHFSKSTQFLCSCALDVIVTSQIFHDYYWENDYEINNYCFIIIYFPFESEDWQMADSVCMWHCEIFKCYYCYYHLISSICEL